VTGPGTKLNPVATELPPATIKNPHPVVDKGWKGVDPKTANELKTKIAKENPTPPNLPKPTITPIKVLRAGPSPAASPKPGATVFGASTPPGGVKPLPTSGPKGSATPLKGNVKGGFNPANPGAAGVTKSPSGMPKPTATLDKPGGAVTPGTQLPSASPTPTPHHSATPPPHHATPVPHHATATPHPHMASTPKVIRKPEGGGGAGGNKGGGTTQHNQPVYHPSGGGGNKPSGDGGKPAGGSGGKPKPTPTAKK